MNQRWIKIGDFKFQESKIQKIFNFIVKPLNENWFNQNKVLRV